MNNNNDAVNIDGKVATLVNVLNEEARVQLCMIDVSNHITAAIKNRKVSDVAAQNQRFDALQGHMEELEEERLMLCDALAKDLLTGPGHVNLNALMRHLEPQHRETLEQARENLKKNIAILQSINASNSILLEASLSDVEKSFAIHLTYTSKPGGYQRHGTSAVHTQTRSIFNQLA